MLTVIALVQRYRAQLPERRAELYEEAIEVLLSHWDAARGLTTTNLIAGREWDAGDRRSLLEPVALWMMEQHVREIEAEELRRQLGQRFYEMVGRVARSGQSRRCVSASHPGTQRPARGAWSRHLCLQHLTFQEHLAARRAVRQSRLH